MEQRPLGQTGITVSALGYGSGAIGGLFVRGEPDEQRRAIARALDAGITYYDTAPSYGNGRSEENLGRVMRELGAWSRVVIGTKARLAAGDLADPVAAVQRSIEESLRRLGRADVDLLQLHNPITSGTSDLETASGSGIDLADLQAGIIAGLRQVKERGLAHHIGFTGLGDSAALAKAATGGTFETVQAYYNAINPSAGYPAVSGDEQEFDGLIDRAAAAGLGVIAIRVLAAGALAARPERHPNAGDPGRGLIRGGEYAHDLDRASVLARLASEASLESPVELALRFALAKPGISTVLVGYSDTGQLEDAIRWAERGPLPDDLARRIVAMAK